MAMNVDDLIGSMQTVHAGDRGQGIEDMRRNLRATLGQTAMGPTTGPLPSCQAGSSRPHPYKKQQHHHRAHNQSQYESYLQQHQQHQQQLHTAGYQSQLERKSRRGSSGSTGSGRNVSLERNHDPSWLASASTSKGLPIDTRNHPAQARGIYDCGGNLSLNAQHLNPRSDAIGGGGAGAGGRSYNSSTGSWGGGSGSSVSGGGSSGFAGFAPAPANTPQATPSDGRGGGFFNAADGNGGASGLLHPPVVGGQGQTLDSVTEVSGSRSPHSPGQGDRSNSHSPRRVVNGFDLPAPSHAGAGAATATAAPLPAPVLMQQY